jgi:hypothetical protein
VIDSLPSDTDLQIQGTDRIKNLKKTAKIDFSSLKKTTEHQNACRALDKFYAN